MWTCLPVQKYMCLDQKEGGKRGVGDEEAVLVWSRRMNNMGILVYECGIVSLLSSYPPSDLGTCTSEQGDRSTFTRKDTQVVCPSGRDEEQLPPLSLHPPSDLGTCTSEQ